MFITATKYACWGLHNNQVFAFGKVDGAEYSSYLPELWAAVYDAYVYKYSQHFWLGGRRGRWMLLWKYVQNDVRYNLGGAGPSGRAV
jgi:hypothetical protein